MAVIPVMIDLTNKNVVVVGGGHIARRRLDTLKDSGAHLTVVSPEVLPEINSLFQKGKIEWKQKEVSSSDLLGAFLIIIATNNKVVNASVKQQAPSTSLINNAAQAAAGDVHFPSRFKRGELTIAISTNGASPLFAKKIKQELEARYDERYESYIEFLSEARRLLKQSGISSREKESYLQEYLSESYLSVQKQKQALQELVSFLK